MLVVTSLNYQVVGFLYLVYRTGLSVSGVQTRTILEIPGEVAGEGSFLSGDGAAQIDDVTIGGGITVPVHTSEGGDTNLTVPVLTCRVSMGGG